MRAFVYAGLLTLVLATPVAAQTLSAPLAGLSFLVGDWTGTGKSENDTTDNGRSSVQPVVGGNALLRRDHTDVTDKTGKLIESFDQIMLIYPEGGTLHADYLDGTHVIHYTSATIQPGQSVQFLTGTSATAPAFRLTYSKQAAGMLAIKFEMQPPGAPQFQIVAEGDMHAK
jgi:hypothetical protein